MFGEKRGFPSSRDSLWEERREGKKLQKIQRIQRPTGIKRGIRKRGSEGDREIEKGIKASEEPQKEA